MYTCVVLYSLMNGEGTILYIKTFDSMNVTSVVLPQR